MCSACTFESGFPQFVAGEGPIPCAGMIIGEAPGAEEERQGRPFVGPSGQLLDSALTAAGLDRSEVYITNVYKHRPEGNRNPTTEELDSHFGYLEDEIDTVKPALLLSLGKVASEWITGRPVAITKEHGRWIADDHMVTYHPAYVLRNPAARDDFFADVRRFAEEVIRAGVYL